MSKYTDLSMERRSQFTPDGKPVYNCCQSVVSVFAQDLGYDEETSCKAATFFRGGMQMGSVCGAIIGGLMALGLAGIDDGKVLNEYYRKIRDHHDGMMNCKDLLRVSAERGEVKLEHCNAMICECIEYVEQALQANGKL